MIKLLPIPQSAASATTQSYVVQVTTDLCKRVCCNAGNILSGSVQFSAGSPTIVNATAIVPITASGSVTMTENSRRCHSTTTHFAETFNVSFTSTDGNTITLTPGASSSTSFADISCCHSSKATVSNTLEIAIS